MELSLTEPSFGQDVFVCYRCKRLRAHTWKRNVADLVAGPGDVETHSEALSTAVCDDCGAVSVWVLENMVWPRYGMSVRPHPDFPADLVDTFGEASELVLSHPNAAALLARNVVLELFDLLVPRTTQTGTQLVSLQAMGLTAQTAEAITLLQLTESDNNRPDLTDDDVTSAAKTLLNLANQVVLECVTIPKQSAALIAQAHSQTTPTPDPGNTPPTSAKPALAAAAI